MIPKTVERSEIFDEFSKEEKKQHFDLTAKKIVPHLDNVYYTVFIKGDHGNEDSPEGVENLVERLVECHELSSHEYDSYIELCGLRYYRANHAIYLHRLSKEDCYDIFIAHYLPNEETPRIEVQIRSSSLVLQGVDQAIKESYEAVRQLLWSFALVPLVCRENRIDYAYHTNAIADPIDYFSDDQLVKHMKSTLRKFQKVGDVGKEIKLDYISLGMRQSNNVFFRVYNKAREVIEKNYKGYFIERWYAHGLISSYDRYCYTYAYQAKSYIVGLLLGRLNWYLEYGKNEMLKDELRELSRQYHFKSPNTDLLRQKLKGLLPDVTMICNIEFETKRKFYASFEGLFENIDLTGADIPAPMKRVYQILHARQTVHDYLTGVTVRFCKDRNARKLELADWWSRLKGTRVSEIAVREFTRIYSRKSDLERAKRMWMRATINLSMVVREDVEPRSYMEDLSDSLACINDNDLHGIGSVNPETGELTELRAPYGYDDMRAKKAVRDRARLKRMHELSEELRAAKAEAAQREKRIFDEFREREAYQASMYTEDPYGPIRRGFFEIEDDAPIIAAAGKKGKK